MPGVQRRREALGHTPRLLVLVVAMWGCEPSPAGPGLGVEIAPFPSAAEAGATVELGLRVTRDGLPVRGLSVSWSVTDGGGSLSATESVTSADGVAEVEWVLGTALVANRVLAAIDGVSTAFNVAALPARPVTVELEGSSGPGVGTETEYRVRLTDRLGNRVTAATLTMATTRLATSRACRRDVNFEGRCPWEDVAALSPRSAMTDDAGELVVSASFPLMGAHRLVALVPALDAGDSLALFVGPPAPESTRFRWLPAPPLPPTPGTGARAGFLASDGETVYILSEFSGGACRHHRYDISSGALAAIAAEPPFGCHYGWGATTSQGLHVLVEAGEGHFVLDPADNTWNRRPGVPERFPGTNSYWLEHTLRVVVEDRLHILDGSRPILWTYDAATDVWTQRRIPWGTLPGEGAVAATLGQLLYVAGGGNQGPGFDFGSIAALRAYHTVGETWATLAPMPAPRRDILGGVVGGLLCVFGGRVASQQGSDPDVFCYDPERDAWEYAPPYPGAVGERMEAVRTVQVGSELWVYPDGPPLRLVRVD